MRSFGIDSSHHAGRTGRQWPSLQRSIDQLGVSPGVYAVLGAHQQRSQKNRHLGPFLLRLAFVPVKVIDQLTLLVEMLTRDELERS